jgi:hypothetical protein
MVLQELMEQRSFALRGIAAREAALTSSDDEVKRLADVEAVVRTRVRVPTVFTAVTQHSPPVLPYCASLRPLYYHVRLDIVLRCDTMSPPCRVAGGRAVPAAA